MSEAIRERGLYEWHGDTGIIIVRVEVAVLGEPKARVVPLRRKGSNEMLGRRRVWVNQSRLHPVQEGDA